LADAAYAGHERRCRTLQAALAQAERVGLGKATSNLFRDRAAVARHRLDVRGFDHVLAVDARSGWVDAEGMVPYDVLVAACLAQGVMPAVVPQLKSITIGGAAAGVGIEATSFKYGLVHETLQELEILLPAGEVNWPDDLPRFAELFQQGFIYDWNTCD
jgi:FAD/FMN-containing dehydrogenase